MKRKVEPELLDHLPPQDRRAVHSRRDLQKINAWMGHARTLRRVLVSALKERSPESIIELGSGDGTLLLKIAKRIGPHWKPSRVVLVDRQPAVTATTKAAFAALSWRVEYAEMDVFEWLERSRSEPHDVTLATLFLHHFADNDLHTLFAMAAAQTRLFLACEPRRSRAALLATRLLRVIGCNHVTRHDARISVKAGFNNTDLSALWPAGNRWRLEERGAGPFTHFFRAQSMKA